MNILEIWTLLFYIVKPKYFISYSQWKENKFESICLVVCFSFAFKNYIKFICKYELFVWAIDQNIYYEGGARRLNSIFISFGLKISPKIIHLWGLCCDEWSGRIWGWEYVEHIILHYICILSRRQPFSTWYQRIIDETLFEWEKCLKKIFRCDLVQLQLPQFLLNFIRFLFLFLSN